MDGSSSFNCLSDSLSLLKILPFLILKTTAIPTFPSLARVITSRSSKSVATRFCFSLKDLIAFI